MLTAEQKAEAEKRLKNISEERAYEDELKARIKKSLKSINDAINSMKNDPKKQIEYLKNLSTQELLNKIGKMDRTTYALTDAQEKMKNDREKLNRDALMLLEEKGRYEGGISEIKKTIVNIQKTLQESVQEETNKRKKIEDDLEKSLDEIRNKIIEFEGETEAFTKQNVELQEKIDAIKAKLSGIEGNYKEKAQEKDKQNQAERDQLTEKLKVLQAEVEKATEMSKEYTGLEKKNFDNKIALYLKIKKFPEFFSSFESSADTLNSCKQQLIKGVQRINNATETIESCNKEAEEYNNQFLGELRKQKEKESRIEDIKKEKEAVRANILELQKQLKEKKAQG